MFLSFFVFFCIFHNFSLFCCPPEVEVERSPRFARQKKSISQPICSATNSSKLDPSPAKKSKILTKSALKTYLGRSSIKISRFWQSLSSQFQNYDPKMPQTLFKIRRPQSTSHQTLHKPFKIKDLSLLTHLAGKSASRRFSWCNSQLLTPKFRRATDQTMFIPSPTTRRTNRLRSILALRGDKSSGLWTKNL